MPKTKTQPALTVLLLITLVNYAAQIPYYVHNYYTPHHMLPGVRAVGLLGFTLLWFLVGYIAFEKKLRFGYRILLSFLIVEALFYTHTMLTGSFIYQLRNHSNTIKAVFIIGYISGITAAYYVYVLLRSHKSRSNGQSV